MRRRRNPLDLGAVRVPLACAVALSELSELGATVAADGRFVVVDAGAVDDHERVEWLLRAARDACGNVVQHNLAVDVAFRGTIREAIARYAFEDAWATRERPVPHKTPRVAYRWADAFIADFERLNGVSIAIAYQFAVQMPGRHRGDASAGEFGFLMLMQAIGHGVAWRDDHPDPGFVLPRSEGLYL